MGKVLAFNPNGVIKENNKIIASNVKKQTLLEQAFSELKKETGIDHYKIILGDSKEKQRLKMRQYQEALLEG